MHLLRLQRPSPRENARAFFRSRRAISLIEIAIVLAIAAIAAAIAAPRYGSMVTRQRVDGAAQRIVSDIAYARSLARSNSSSVQIRFNPGGNYGIPSFSSPLSHTNNYAVDLSAAPYQCRILGGAANAPAAGPGSVASASTFSLSFDGFGEPSAVGFVIIRCGEWNRMITLDATGQATISKPTDAAVRSMIANVQFDYSQAPASIATGGG